MKDVIIIGGGPASMSAGVYAARRKLETMVIAKEFGGQVANTDKVENYLGFKSISGPELADKFEEHLKDYDVETEEGHAVNNVKQKGSKVEVELENGDKYEAKTAIVAAGGRRRQLNVPGEEKLKNKGVSYCAICDGPLFQDEKIAIVGGGYSGTESALYMSKIAEKVFLINIGESLVGEPITIEKVNENDNIEVLNNAQTTEILGDSMVEGLKYKDTESNEKKELDVAGVFIEIGTIPNSDIVDVDTDEDGYIIVDDDMRTSKERIFAAGDITSKGIKQIAVSIGQGCTAALEVDSFLSSRE